MSKSFMQIRVAIALGIMATLIVVGSLLSGCGFEGDPMIDDMYTQNVYPGIARTYSIGSRNLPYLNGWFKDGVYINGVPLPTAFTGLTDTPNSYIGEGGNFLTVNVGETGLELVAAAGVGDVTAAANLVTDMIVRGDGGLKGVKTSLVSIDNFGTIYTPSDINTDSDINAGNDVNVTNDLDVTDDADIGGDLNVVGTLTVGGYPVPDPNYAEMYKHESAVVTDIQDMNDWHLVRTFVTGEVGGGWVFHAGKQLDITAYADNGDGKTQITSALHALVNGGVVSISGTANYDGVWVVEQITVNTFVIDTPFVDDDGASTGQHGSHFISDSVYSTGKYLITYSMSITPSNPNDIVEVVVFVNATQCIKCESQTKLGAITDYQNVAGQSILNITAGDVIGMAIRNTSGGGDFLIRNGNMTLFKLGN